MMNNGAEPDMLLFYQNLIKELIKIKQEMLSVSNEATEVQNSINKSKLLFIN